MKKLFAILCLLAMTVAVAEARAQTDPENAPNPPVEQLGKLQPFVGLYVHTDQYWEGVGPWAGTLEVGPAVKGWYVEFVVNTHYETIDRQHRMIMTWDEVLQRYRVWRFNTLPPPPPGSVEGEARFVGDTLVMEWNMRSPDGRRGTLRNRVFMNGPDELVIISEVLPEGASEWVRLSEFRNRRRL